MLKRIEHEIEEVEVAIASVTSRIQSTYVEYAQSVAQAVEQQLIVGTYQICTHDSPQTFLALSLAERQKLQHDIQHLAKSAVEEVSQALQECDREQQTDQEAVDRVLIKTLTDTSRTANELLVAARVLSLPIVEDSTKLQLRLSEVEFTNRVVMSHRGELRVLSARLNQLHDELERKLKSKVIAEAELAWRSSWTEL